MFKLLRMFIAVLLILSIAATPVLAQDTPTAFDMLDDRVNSLVGPDKAKGAVLSVVSDGEIQVCKGYGFADEYNNIAADGEKTAFRIGSVSKTFVAVAVQLLQQQGKLDMNLDISTYLEPDFPKLTYPVTMQQLLTHTAGFEETITGMVAFNVSDTEPLAESMRKYMPAQVFEPGKLASYSNYGIALAAYVVERITNQDFAQYCREQIFLPLDMDRTTFEHMHKVSYVSKPYLPSGKETLEPYMNLYPEGSAVSTAEDMAKYMQWLMDDQDSRVLSAASKQEMFRKQFSMAEELEGSGYVWNRKARNGKLYYDKKGETLHFYTRIALYPQQKTGVFLSFNTYLPEHEITAVMKEVTDLVYGEVPQFNSHSSKSTLNISGLYANNWSSYDTTEKLLRYLVPGKMLFISKTAAGGYSLNGEEMLSIGENLFSSPIGLLKFQLIDGQTVIATESSITYSRIPFWQHRNFLILIPLLFFVAALICLLQELLLLIRRKKHEVSLVNLVLLLIQLLSLCTLIALLVNGISSYSLLAFTFPLKISGWFILGACAVGVIYAVYRKQKHHVTQFLPLASHILGILFCIWMVWLHIL